MSITRYLRKENLRILSHGFFHPGYCPVCEKATLFFRPCPYSHIMREYYRCIWCRATPRYRAFNLVLNKFFPDWRSLSIHESSPGGALSEKIARECVNYVASDFYPDRPKGVQVGRSVNQDLQNQTFPDESFDLVITMDVFEHLPFPDRAFREIARTLKPGGAHIFTVPCDMLTNTKVRAKITPEGKLEHLLPEVYHGNPIDEKGSLVFRDWGHDMIDVIRQSSGLDTDVLSSRHFWLGIEPQLNNVFISKKPREST